MSNILLIFCFVMGISLQLCRSDGGTALEEVETLTKHEGMEVKASKPIYTKEDEVSVFIGFSSTNDYALKMAGLKRVLQAVEASEAMEKLDCFTQGLFKFENFIQAKIAGGKGSGLVKGSCGNWLLLRVWSW